MAKQLAHNIFSFVIHYCKNDSSKYNLSHDVNLCKKEIKLNKTQHTHIVVVVVVVVNFIKHQNRAITGEPVAARAAPSYQYAMVLVIMT